MKVWKASRAQWHTELHTDVFGLLFVCSIIAPVCTFHLGELAPVIFCAKPDLTGYFGDCSPLHKLWDPTRSSSCFAGRCHYLSVHKPQQLWRGGVTSFPNQTLGRGARHLQWLYPKTEKHLNLLIWDGGKLPDVVDQDQPNPCDVRATAKGFWSIIIVFPSSPICWQWLNWKWRWCLHYCWQHSKLLCPFRSVVFHSWVSDLLPSARLLCMYLCHRCLSLSRSMSGMLQKKLSNNTLIFVFYVITKKHHHISSQSQSTDATTTCRALVHFESIHIVQGPSLTHTFTPQGWAFSVCIVGCHSPRKGGKSP